MVYRCKLLVVLILFMSATIAINPQTYPYETYIETWNSDEPDQTIQAQYLYDDLTAHKDPVKYNELCRYVNDHLRSRPNIRIQARFTMYRILWGMEHGYNSKSFLELLDTILQEVYDLKDRQLLSELYLLYGEIYLHEGRAELAILYNLKALDIQESLGIERFPRIAHLYFSVAMSLYVMKDYERSIFYALKSEAQHKQNKYYGSDIRNYVFLHDVSAASYSKLNNPEKAIQEYELIIYALQHYSDPEKQWSKFWMNLCKANIAGIRIKQGVYDNARNIINEHIASSIEFNQMTNVAQAFVLLAAVDEHENKWMDAKDHYIASYRLADSTQAIEVLQASCFGLYRCYKYLNLMDSAYFYYGKYFEYKQIGEDKYSKLKIQVAEAEIQYEKTQHKLEETYNEIQDQLFMRKLIVTGCIMLVVSGLLFYVWRRNKYVYRIRLEQKQREHAEKEIIAAQKHVELFKQLIVEKNELIDKLQNLSEKPDITSRSIPGEQLIHAKLLTEEDWSKFRKEFATAYPGFFDKLKDHMEGISPAMERLAALIFLKLDNSQMANALGISKESVSRSRRRLKTSLHLSPEDDLDEFIHSIKPA